MNKLFREPRIALSLGPLTVLATMNPFSFMPQEQFFWTDSKFAGQHGPFNTLCDAVEHYTEAERKYKENRHQNGLASTQQALGQIGINVTIDEVPDNVIKVDFVARRRII